MSAMTYARKTHAPSAPTLKIGPQNDAFEREADRTADEVMSGAGTTAQWSLSGMSITPPLQRKCSCGKNSGGEEECEQCKAEATLQRKAAGPAEMDYAPPLVHEVLRSAGEPMDRAARSFFEPRFGHDFSKVRIHAGAQAAESARAVNALAYTVGNNVIFDAGQYAPHSSAGRKLLAHELAHTIQQSGGNGFQSTAMRLQRVTAKASAIPKGIHCFTDSGPSGNSPISLTGVKLSGTLDSAQKKQVADFSKKWVDAGSKDFIAVEGYASPDTANDSEAQQQSNWKYSCSRAETVQRELIKLGVPSKLILSWGHGETDMFSPFGKDPDPNRRVELSMITMQKTGAPAGSGPAADAPKAMEVKGKTDDKSSQVEVKPSGGNKAAEEKKTDQGPQQKTEQQKGEGDKPKADDDDKPFSITFEFDLKNDFKHPKPPDAVPSQSFLCDHGIYQIGLKWNKGIKVGKTGLQFLNEPEFDVNILDSACKQNPSLTLQVNIMKYTIFKKIIEADLVGVLGLPDGWATGLQNFPFTAGGQLKLESTPFARRFPSLDGLKIGVYGGLGFEQGVQVPGAGEEARARVFTIGGYIGLDHDFDFSGK